MIQYSLNFHVLITLVKGVKTMINEPQDLTPFGFAPGYYIYRDGRVWSTRQRGAPGFKNLDYTGCTLLKLFNGSYARRSVKTLAFQIYVVPELLASGYVPIYNKSAYINRDGVAYSSNIGEQLRWQLAHQYYYIHVGGKDRLVHRVVAETFIPNPYNYPEVDHIDGNKSNNSVSNLRWTNRSGNMKYAYCNGALNNSLSKAFAAKGLEFIPKMNV